MAIPTPDRHGPTARELIAFTDILLDALGRAGEMTLEDGARVIALKDLSDTVKVALYDAFGYAALRKVGVRANL